MVYDLVPGCPVFVEVGGHTRTTRWTHPFPRILDTNCYDQEQAHHGGLVHSVKANSGSNTLLAVGTMSEQEVSPKHNSITGSVGAREEVPYAEEEEGDEEEDEEGDDDECDRDDDDGEDDNTNDDHDKQEEDEDCDDGDEDGDDGDEEDDEEEDEEGRDSHHGSPQTPMPPPMPPYYPYPYAYPVHPGHVQPPQYLPPPPTDYLLTGPQNPHTYTDASGLGDPIPDTRRNRGGVTEPFPEKLHRMLEGVEREGLSDVVSFFSHGRAFAIHKPRRFVSEVMLRYFRQSRLTSFQRQLNLYGFKRITQGPDNGGYYHELFLKGRVGLCVNMKRVKVKGQLKLKRDPDSEPNFYAMRPVTSAAPPPSPGSAPAPPPAAYYPPPYYAMANYPPYTAAQSVPMTAYPAYPYYNPYAWGYPPPPSTPLSPPDDRMSMLHGSSQGSPIEKPETPDRTDGLSHNEPETPDSLQQPEDDPHIESL